MKKTTLYVLSLSFSHCNSSEGADLSTDTAALAVIIIKLFSDSIRYRDRAVRTDRCTQQTLSALFFIKYGSCCSPLAGIKFSGCCRLIYFIALCDILPRASFINSILYHILLLYLSIICTSQSLFNMLLQMPAPVPAYCRRLLPASWQICAGRKLSFPAGIPFSP